MTLRRRRSATVAYPTDLEVVFTRQFDAPIQLVFEVTTDPEHVRRWFAPFDEDVTICEIDFRVGGNYHIVMVTPDGIECSFRGTYLEIDPPFRTVATWLFEGWPDAEAVETVALQESDGVTTLTDTLAFQDHSGRSHMTETDGFEASYNNLEDVLGSMIEGSDID